MPDVYRRDCPPLSGRWFSSRNQRRKLSIRSVAAARWWAQQHPHLSLAMQAKRLAPIFGVKQVTMEEALTRRSWFRDEPHKR